MKFNRRTLFRAGSTALMRALLPPLPRLDFYADGGQAQSAGANSSQRVQGFARALQYGVIIRSEPSLQAPKTGALIRDNVVPIYGQVDSGSGSKHNSLWYQVQGGYVYSANVHPVRWQYNPPVADVPKEGLWAELTVPFADVRAAPSDAAPIAKYRYYGGTVYRILKAVKGSKITLLNKPGFSTGEDEWWYQIEDEAFKGDYFLPAKYMRIIPQEEFGLISPDVPPEEKKVVVSLGEQRVRAFERGREVYSCATASGVRYSNERDFSTTPGDFFVFRKTPSQHMYGGAVGDDGSFDLPGVSWVSYFTVTGIAIHATYWHNDFGVTRSHGCINVLTEHAKWFWRWTLPLNDSSKRYTDITKRSQGTEVSVI